MSDWTEKYRPQTLSAIRGNDKARDSFREWAETWDDHREAVILHGSPGVGKTSAAHALANDMGWSVTEMNASDDRGKDVVSRVAGEASKSSSLSGFEDGSPTKRLVVLDEADNLSGNADRGGTRAMTEVVRSTNQPVVLVANEFYDMSRGLRNACRDVQFRDVSARSIVPALRNICREEDIEFEESALKYIAEQTSGDLRSAINDLQAVADGRERLTREMVVTGERDRTEGIFDFLEALFQDANAETALLTSYDVDETPDDLIRWIDQNLPKEYEDEEAADAYGHLANADRWLGRVRATQNYSYWRYAGDNMTAGVAAARAGPKGGWSRYSPPKWFGGDKTRDEVARRVAAVSGVSVATARSDVLPFLSAMTHHCKNRELTVRMAARYDMDASEVSFVTGSGENTNKVASIVEDARRRREDAAVERSDGAFDPPPEPENDDEGDGDGESKENAHPAVDDENGTVPGDDGSAADGEGEGDDDQQSGLGDFM